MAQYIQVGRLIYARRETDPDSLSQDGSKFFSVDKPRMGKKNKSI